MGEVLGRQLDAQTTSPHEGPPLLTYACHHVTAPGWSQRLSISLNPSRAETGFTHLCVPVTSKGRRVIPKGGNGETEAGATLSGKELQVAWFLAPLPRVHSRLRVTVMGQFGHFLLRVAFSVHRNSTEAETKARASSESSDPTGPTHTTNFKAQSLKGLTPPPKSPC